MSIAVDSKGNPIYPKPCKVVMVLGALPCYASLAREGEWLNAAVGGVYRLDDPGCAKVQFRSLPEALTYIRDHGGEWIAGEPLPEKPEDTWALLDVGSVGTNRSLTIPYRYRCGRCLDGWSRTAPQRCCTCGAKLASPQPWGGIRAEGYPQ